MSNRTVISLSAAWCFLGMTGASSAQTGSAVAPSNPSVVRPSQSGTIPATAMTLRTISPRTINVQPAGSPMNRQTNGTQPENAVSNQTGNFGGSIQGSSNLQETGGGTPSVSEVGVQQTGGSYSANAPAVSRVSVQQTGSNDSAMSDRLFGGLTNAMPAEMGYANSAMLPSVNQAAWAPNMQEYGLAQRYSWLYGGLNAAMLANAPALGNNGNAP